MNKKTKYMFELYDPFPIKYRSQKFGENATSFYKENSLKGHTADDWAVPFGTKIPCCADSYVYSTYNHPDRTKYRAVYTLIETDTDIIYEASYGHLDEIHVPIGTHIKVGDILGTVGNTGDVYSFGVKVTKEEQRAGSTKGAHLHGVQIRKCRMVETTRHDRNYLHDGNGMYRYKGHYIEVVDYNNGFNGCIDGVLFKNGRVAIPQFGAIDEKEIDQAIELLTPFIDPKKWGLIEYIKRLLKLK